MQLKWDYKKQAMEKENKSDKILFSKKFTQTNKKASFKWINPKGAVRVMKNANFLLRQCDQILPLRRNVALKIFGKLFWCLPIFWTYFGKIWCFGQIFIVLHGGQILKKIIKQSGHTFFRQQILLSFFCLFLNEIGSDCRQGPIVAQKYEGIFNRPFAASFSLFLSLI